MKRMPARRVGIMNAVAAKKERVHVTLTDVCAGPYVVEAEHSDGSLVIAPDTSWKAVRTSGRGEELTRNGGMTASPSKGCTCSRPMDPDE